MIEPQKKEGQATSLFVREKGDGVGEVAARLGRYGTTMSM